jgi:tRNA pseudouridine32 synthase / 23S rRNA pseudouridine746 synthase
VALARVNVAPSETHRRVANRVEAGDPWYRRQIVEGAVNAVTEIELVEVRDGIGWFRLRPETGKKHQLRVHMAAIGYPIIGDLVYPVVREKSDADPPLQLLARSLGFVDPLSGVARVFESGRQLANGRVFNTD